MYAKKEFDINIYKHSDTAVRLGIRNEPTQLEVTNIKLLHERIIVPLLGVIDGKLLITSGFRSIELNKTLKGSNTSQHCKGQAVDLVYFDSSGKQKNKTLFDFIRENLEFDQLIWENGGRWVHVSYKEKGNRKQVLEL